MGRKAIEEENKKKKLSITISEENFISLKDVDINRSKLINWLLEQHFNKLKK